MTALKTGARWTLTLPPLSPIRWRSTPAGSGGAAAISSKACPFSARHPIEPLADSASTLRCIQSSGYPLCEASVR